MAPIWKRTAFLWLITAIALPAISALSPPAAQALPAPLSPEELAARSDVILEGQVAQVWLYFKRVPNRSRQASSLCRTRHLPS
jgi:hypothetical protein